MVRCFILCFLLVTLLPAVAQADVHYRVDFENGDTSAAIFSNMEESMAGGQIDAVANPAPDATNSPTQACRLTTVDRAAAAGRRTQGRPAMAGPIRTAAERMRPARTVAGPMVADAR